MTHNDVSPYHRSLAVFADRCHQFFYKVCIQAPRSGLFRQLSVLSFTQIECLITADIAISGTEQRDKLVNHAFNEHVTLFIADINSIVRHSVPQAMGQLRRLYVKFVEVFKSFKPEQFVHVAERRKRRDKINAPAAAKGVKFPDLTGGERVLIAPELGNVTEGESMFDIKLQLVDLVECQFIGKELERIKRRHLAARYIVIKTPCREIRGILDLQARQHRPVLFNQLHERLRTIENAPRPLPCDSNTFPADCKAISL